MTYGDDAPTLSELNAEAWEDTKKALPWWFKAPLRITRPARGYHGAPSQTVTCDDHPTFHAHGTRDSYLYWTERHIREAHAGVKMPPPVPVPDPWAEGMKPSPEVPF